MFHLYYSIFRLKTPGFKNNMYFDKRNIFFKTIIIHIYRCSAVIRQTNQTKIVKSKIKIERKIVKTDNI